jgi:hypothetical protein
MPDALHKFFIILSFYYGRLGVYKVADAKICVSALTFSLKEKLKNRSPTNWRENYWPPAYQKPIADYDCVIPIDGKILGSGFITIT